MLGSMIKVLIAGEIHEYPNMVAEYGDWIAGCGETIAIHDAIKEERKNAREGRMPGVSGKYWVSDLDYSGLAYLVSIHASGKYKILGAAPLSGAPLKEVYAA